MKVVNNSNSRWGPYKNKKVDMLDKIFKTGLLLLLISAGCKKEGEFKVKALPLPAKEHKVIDTVSKQLNTKDFSLKIVSYLLRDTLNLEEYKENMFSNPIVLDQDLLFFKGKKLLKQHKLPIEKIKVKTISDSTVIIMNTPIYKICSVKNSNEEFYVVKASYYDFCNGSDCPEFIAVYSMKGEVLLEGYAGDEIEVPLHNVIDKYGIDLNESTNYIQVSDFYDN